MASRSNTEYLLGDGRCADVSPISRARQLPGSKHIEFNTVYQYYRWYHLVITVTVPYDRRAILGNPSYFLKVLQGAL